MPPLNQTTYNIYKNLTNRMDGFSMRPWKTNAANTVGLLRQRTRNAAAQFRNMSMPPSAKDNYECDIRREQ